MTVQRYFTYVNGELTWALAVVTSAGAGDALKHVALDSSGRLDASVMPAGIGANTKVIPASEAIGAGKFVNYWDNAGTINVRLADNSNVRPAQGFVTSAVSSGANATVYPLGVENTALTGLTLASRYFLGTAGGVVISTSIPTTSGTIIQFLGVSSSTTGIVTTSDQYIKVA
jgi:hypothetical protein